MTNAKVAGMAPRFLALECMAVALMCCGGLSCGGQADQVGEPPVITPDSAVPSSNGPLGSAAASPAPTSPGDDVAVPSGAASQAVALPPAASDVFYTTPEAEPLPVEECHVPAAEPVPAASACSPAIEACEPSTDTCLSSPLAVTLRKLLREACDVRCGDLILGLSEGCITLLSEQSYLSSDLECVREQLIGRRWDCAPREGMARAYMGSCTLP